LGKIFVFKMCLHGKIRYEAFSELGYYLIKQNNSNEILPFKYIDSFSQTRTAFRNAILNISRLVRKQFIYCTCRVAIIIA